MRAGSGGVAPRDKSSGCEGPVGGGGVPPPMVPEPMSPVNWSGPMSRVPPSSKMCTSLKVADALMLVLLLELTAKPTYRVSGNGFVKVRVEAFT